jgi:hypothetical protein
MDADTFTDLYFVYMHCIPSLQRALGGNTRLKVRVIP